MHARITSKFRIAQGDGTRTYFPGDTAEGAHAEWAIANRTGEEIDAPIDVEDADGEDTVAAAPEAKAKTRAPRNKAASAKARK